MDQQTNYADMGFRPDMSVTETGVDLGPAMLACFAFLIFTQGLIYILKPDMTGRSLTASPEKIRRIGLGIVAVSGVVLYIAFSWWSHSWSVQNDRPARPPVEQVR